MTQEHAEDRAARQERHDRDHVGHHPEARRIRRLTDLVAELGEQLGIDGVARAALGFLLEDPLDQVARLGARAVAQGAAGAVRAHHLVHHLATPGVLGAERRRSRGEECEQCQGSEESAH